MIDGGQTQRCRERTLPDRLCTGGWEVPVPEPEASLRGWQALGNLRQRLFAAEGWQVGRVGRYRLLEKLGQGGLGVVYAAHDPELDRRVALKLLKPQHGIDRERADERMLREARAMARLTHRNVVEVFDLGSFRRLPTDDDNSPYGLFIVMQLLEGITLERWLQTPRTWREVVEVMSQAGRGLAAAHAAGLVHRDFKPANVIVGDDGMVKVLDFGLARAALDGDPQLRSTMLDDSDDELSSTSGHITQTGVVLGTPSYMAPEQHLGGEADHRSDQFAFCVALFRALYGNHPFIGSSARRLFRSKVQGRIQPPDDPQDVPRWLDDAMRRGLSASAEDRFDSMEAFLEALQEPPRRHRSPWLAGTLVATVVTAGLGFWLGDSGPDCEGGAQRVHEIWGAAARDDVRQAFVASGSSLSRDAFGRVDLALDDYADTWAAIRADSCGLEAAVLDRRMRCLDGGAAHLEALVGVLSEADASVVERATVAAARLPTLGACLDDVVLANEHPPPPVDEVAAVRDIDAMLARVDALEHAGKYEAALAVAQAAMDAATKVEHGPSRVGAVYARGRIRDGLGRREGAIADLSEAVGLASATGQDRLAAGAASSLVVANTVMGDYDAAQRWSRFARALIVRLGDDPEIHARVANAEGSLLRELGRYDAARATFERALRSDGMRPLTRATLLGNLGNVAIVAGDPATAHGLHQETLEILAEALGEHHPHVATTRTNLGIVAGLLGRSEEARGLLTSARDALVNAFGVRDERVAHCDHALAQILERAGDHASAEAHFWAAEQVFRANLGPDHPNVAVAQLGRASALLAQRRPGDAREPIAAAEAIITRAFGPEHPLMTRALIERGRAELGLGRLGAARATLDRAVAIAVEAGGDPQDEAEARMYLATAMWAVPGERAAAQAMVQRVLGELPDTVPYDEARGELHRWLVEHRG